MFASFWRFLIVTLFGLALILYIASIGEGMENLKMEGDYFENVPRTLKYFFLWVLPYWWFLLLTAGMIIAFALIIIKKKRSKNVE